MNSEIRPSATPPLIALISAVPAAIAPTRAALEAVFPEATLWNILDDRLLEDAAAQGGLTAPLAERMTRLIDHAIAEGADGVLLTCSMYGPVAHKVAGGARIPVLGPDDALFAAVADRRYRDVVVVSSSAGTLADSLQRIRLVLPAETRVRGVVAEHAAVAAKTGDIAMVAAHVSRAVRGIGGEPEVIVLGQFSLAPSASAIHEALGIEVLAGPQHAVIALRAQITEAAR